MKREADKNRVKRAIEHLNAAITNLKSIKSENLEIGEPSSIISASFDIKWCVNRLERLIKEEQQ